MIVNGLLFAVCVVLPTMLLLMVYCSPCVLSYLQCDCQGFTGMRCRHSEDRAYGIFQGIFSYLSHPCLTSQICLVCTPTSGDGGVDAGCIGNGSSMCNVHSICCGCFVCEACVVCVVCGMWNAYGMHSLVCIVCALYLLHVVFVEHAVLLSVLCVEHSVCSLRNMLFVNCVVNVVCCVSVVCIMCNV